ncbi:MAG: hypothetical protein M9904_07665 [Chitinophagaceae bacterium]|nr:hypothetical protein [Chitinophagaceae bacterium]
MIKPLFLLISFTIFALHISAQKKNPATQKEIDARMKEAQDALDKLTPEQRKMMEQMGMSTKVPAMPASVKGASDAQIAAAVNKDGVPAKNAVLIAAIPNITLTASNLSAYIGTLNEYINKNLPDESKQAGQYFYSGLKANKYSTSEIANAGVGFWTSGQPEIAVYMLGKACSDNNTDDDMLSNFAAMLSMGGAPHRAIPLLEYLSKKYPGNTTILNNLGQAWFYLGETDKANVQLDKAVKAFAYHPQANYTQCLIQESKGNKTAAIEKMKNSLAYSYSLDKVNKLRKLGYSVKSSDMRKPFHPDPDPLALERFIRPEAPKSYEDEMRLKADWDAFQKQAYDKMTALAQAMIPAQKANAQEAERLYQQYQKGGVTAMTTNASVNENIYRKTAEKNLEEMSKDGGMNFRFKKAKAAIDDLRKDFNAKDEAQRKIIEKESSIKAESETELAKKGENIGFDNCVVQRKYSEWVYKNYNLLLEDTYKNYLHQLKLKITEELYWKQFTQDEATFESTKNAAKKEWLGAISNTRYIATNKYGNDCKIPEAKNSKYKLADFDDINCKFKTSLGLGPNRMIFECGRSSIEFDAGVISGNLNYKFDDKGNNKFVKGTLEAKAGKEISANAGPLQAGAAANAGMGVEFTSNGVEDVYVTGEVSVNAGTGPVNVEVGASGKMSLISGNMSGGISGFGK